MQVKGSKFLVTGGTGFIGSNLVHALVAQGAKVTALDSGKTGVEHNLKGLDVEYVHLDLSKTRAWIEEGNAPEALQGHWDGIFHHGDITDPRYSNEKELYEHNLKSFQSVLELALKARCRLVFASTANLYGNGSLPMQEDQPKEMITVYGQSKLDMEKKAAEYWKMIPIVGLRYFNVYGPREEHKGRAASMVLHLFRQMEQGKNPRLFEHGEQKRDFIYVKDAVRANFCALTAPSGIYNVGTGVASDFNCLVEALNSVMGTQKPAEYFPMPYDPKTYQVHTVADTARAESILKFKAEWSLKRGVQDYLEWLKS